MSKERARRRAEREVAEQARREQRQRQVARDAARRRWRVRLAAPVRAATSAARRTRTDSLLTRQRRRQDALLVGLLLAVHTALWLFTDSWLWRVSAAVLTVMAWPVLVTVLFDRRSRL